VTKDLLMNRKQKKKGLTKRKRKHEVNDFLCIE